MRITDITNNYLNTIKLEFSRGTYEHYRDHFKHFINWSDSREITLIEQVTEEVITEYIFHMKETCTNRTINIRIGNLKRCFRKMNIELEFLQEIPKLR